MKKNISTNKLILNVISLTLRSLSTTIDTHKGFVSTLSTVLFGSVNMGNSSPTGSLLVTEDVSFFSRFL